jgi:Spy/CpxP family protein refolding chaperone
MALHQHRVATGPARTGRALAGLLLLSATLFSAAAGPGQAAQAAAPVALERRLESVAKALALEPQQKVQLRQILLGQREQVRQIWSDTTLPAAYRIAATQASSDKAAESIRAMLNPAQRQQYQLTRSPLEANPDSARPDVAQWIGALQQR